MEHRHATTKGNYFFKNEIKLNLYLRGAAAGTA